jgi:hypothetical protein
VEETLHAASGALGRAGRWDVAVALLDEWTARAEPDDANLRRATLHRADLLADKAFWTSTPVPADPPAAGEDDVVREMRTVDWPTSWSRARRRYTTLLQDRIAGRGVDEGAARDLLARLHQLRAGAPDGTTELAVRFLLGLVHENLLGDPTAATPHWTAAATSEDGDTAASALRHLGGQCADAGDEARAHALWWESFRLRARDGDLPGAVAQLALLAPSATLGEAVTAWIEAAGLAVLRGQGLAAPS